MKLRQIVSASLGIFFTLTSPSVFAVHFGLTDEQMTSVLSGQPIIQRQSDKNKLIFELKKYLFIHASPDQAQSVFGNYANHATILKNVFMRESVITQQTPSLTTVKYKAHYGITREVHLTPSYTLNYAFRQTPSGGYQFNWSLGGAEKHMSDRVGSVQFEPYAGGTLMIYDDRVDIKISDKEKAFATPEKVKKVEKYFETIISQTADDFARAIDESAHKTPSEISPSETLN